MAHIFISYSKQDIDFVRYLRALLEKEGFAVWMDEVRLQPSARWWKSIEENIDTCSAFIVVMSPSAEESDWVEREILRAENRKKPIFPLLLIGEIWSRLANIQCQDMRAGFGAQLTPSFIQSLRHVCGGQKVKTLDFTMQQGNIVDISADVIVLKYARAFYGADMVVAQRMVDAISDDPDQAVIFEDARADDNTEVSAFLKSIKPALGEFSMVETNAATAAPHALYIGMPRVRDTGYDHLRQFGKWSLEFLAEAAPETRHVAMTIHGPGFGLDETEATMAQFAGFVDAIEAGKFPHALEKITVVEYVPARVKRLRQALEPHFTEAQYAEAYPDNNDSRWGYRLRLSVLEEDQPSQESPTAIANAGIKIKNTVFAIVPHQLEDVFYYGIQAPVHAQGLLCERMDVPEMNAELFSEIKQRIDSAVLVIIEMSEPTAYEYLQLGYAWGKNCPTILVSNKEIVHLNSSLYVEYDKIRELAAGVTQALDRAREAGWM